MDRHVEVAAELFSTVVYVETAFVIVFPTLATVQVVLLQVQLLKYEVAKYYTICFANSPLP